MIGLRLIELGAPGLPLRRFRLLAEHIDGEALGFLAGQLLDLGAVLGLLGSLASDVLGEPVAQRAGILRRQIGHRLVCGHAGGFFRQCAMQSVLRHLVGLEDLSVQRRALAAPARLHIGVGVPVEHGSQRLHAGHLAVLVLERHYSVERLAIGVLIRRLVEESRRLHVRQDIGRRITVRIPPADVVPQRPRHVLGLEVHRLGQARRDPGRQLQAQVRAIREPLRQPVLLVELPALNRQVARHALQVLSVRRSSQLVHARRQHVDEHVARRPVELEVVRLQTQRIELANGRLRRRPAQRELHVLPRPLAKRVNERGRALHLAQGLPEHLPRIGQVLLALARQLDRRSQVGGVRRLTQLDLCRRLLQRLRLTHRSLDPLGLRLRVRLLQSAQDLLHALRRQRPMQPTRQHLSCPSDTQNVHRRAIQQRRAGHGKRYRIHRRVRPGEHMPGQRIITASLAHLGQQRRGRRRPHLVINILGRVLQARRRHRQDVGLRLSVRGVNLAVRIPRRLLQRLQLLLGRDHRHRLLRVRHLRLQVGLGQARQLLGDSLRRLTLRRTRRRLHLRHQRARLSHRHSLARRRQLLGRQTIGLGPRLEVVRDPRPIRQVHRMQILHRQRFRPSRQRQLAQAGSGSGIGIGSQTNALQPHGIAGAPEQLGMMITFGLFYGLWG